ncbi:MAG: BamA/TamA family outer membrane protein [Kiritimatiellae bacterium]|nr:BamA/TamA family outer membrane protein [Kiritimatiellia bacterium]
MRRLPALAVLALILFAAGGLPARGQKEKAIRYDVRVEGVPDRALRRDLLLLSESWQLHARPPPTIRLLRRRAERDTDTLRLALRARGYYAAEVEAACAAGKKKNRVLFRVQTGPVFLVRSVSIGVTTGSLPAAASPARLGLETNRPLVAQTVLDAQARVLRAFQAGGYPAARFAEQSVVVDHAAQRADIVLRVDPGPPVRFGPVSVRGLTRLRESYVQRLVPWREGERYDIDRVDAFRDSLARGGLFSAVAIESGAVPESGDESPVTVTLKERKRRRVELGVGYTADGGAETHASWLHRNLFGGAEQLQLEAGVNEFNLYAEAAFRRPQFLRTDQDLLLDLKVQQEEGDAYTSRWVRASGGLERALPRRLRAQAGLALRYSEVEQEEREEFFLWSLPARLLRDTSDDLLDPTRGARWTLLGEPTYDLLNGGMAFFRVRLTASKYWSFSKRPLLVLAARTAAGSLIGPSRGDLPADERFYAGGGGSIRGYGYQTVGPLNEDDSPLGGRSLLESSLELRWRATRTMGLVLFADGGTAFEEKVPDFDERYLWGAGLGWRYYTSFGLARFDVAVPLDRRPDLDEDYQFYLSIGQAF